MAYFRFGFLKNSNFPQRRRRPEQAPSTGTEVQLTLYTTRVMGT